MYLLLACAQEEATWDDRADRYYDFVEADLAEEEGDADSDEDEVDVPWADIEEVDAYKSYSLTYSDAYATNNYSRTYGTGSSQNPFHDYGSEVAGGNCTNFVSQALIAGFRRSGSAQTVYASRADYDTDKFGSGLQWYWISDTDRGPAFTGANELYEYARDNQDSWRGVHFEEVTHDTLTEFMDYWLVRVGDVIFADWDHDGTIDHSMIVTDFNRGRDGYDEIQVTYQSTNTHNRGLGDINEYYAYQALFYVYRPTDYNPDGL